MKKFLKIILTIFIFLFILFCINLTRNFIILNNIYKTQSDFFANLDNYYFTEEFGTVSLFNTRKIQLYKDNTYLCKTITNNKEDYIWLNKNTKEFIFSDNSVINPNYETTLNFLENSLIFINYFNENSIKLNDLVYSNLFNILTLNNTTDWLQEQTYIIRLKNSNFEFYIGKNSSLIRAIKYNDSSGIGGYIFKIEKNVVTSEDIKKPEFNKNTT